MATGCPALETLSDIEYVQERKREKERGRIVGEGDGRGER
jgi:hypothetical protein